MAKISLGIYDEHKLTGQGIRALLADNKDFEVLFTCNDSTALNKILKDQRINILITSIHHLSPSLLAIINETNVNHPNIKILVLSVLSTEELILNIVKAGAAGFLSAETDKAELAEAIYTLRNGHDYFSKSITHLLLNKYISKMKNNNSPEKEEINRLSPREIEILKMWGEGYPNQEIADKLFISIRTVESHKNHIMQKLNLRTTVDMIRFAIRNNLIEL